MLDYENSNENILCPICLKKVKIDDENDDVNNEIDLTKYELNDLLCDVCNLNFIYIICVYCNQKIYFKKGNSNLELNGMNGFNIKCPYLPCCKYFFLTKCPKCKLVQKIQKFIKEGELLKCKNDKCNCEYLQVRCPIKGCSESISFMKPKRYSNNPKGITYNHKSTKVYQKINCFFCYRPIVFISTENHIERYFEAQRVECPYEDCKKKFNRIICPYCSEEIFYQGGWYKMGTKIRCKNCKNIFGKLLCPKCNKLNVLEDCFFKGGPMICGFKNCSAETIMINCLYCRRINTFPNNVLSQGRLIKCGYEDCEKKFNEVICPSCKEINPFPLGDFSFGKVYKCQYITCNKEYQILICCNCLSFFATNEGKEGRKFQCSKCQTILINWECPFCKYSIIDNNSKLEFGQMVKCPHCKKIYSFIRCLECLKLVFSDENINILGKSVKCKSLKCGINSVTVICPKCKIRNFFSGRTENVRPGEKIACYNCKNDFEFSQNDDDIIYSENLTTLKELKGEPIKFGKSSVDDNFLLTEKLLIQCDIYKNSSKCIVNDSSISKSNNPTLDSTIKTVKECIICHINQKESVFMPCGHRCVCYICAVIFFQVYKKCPKCEQNATGIIERIYD